MLRIRVISPESPDWPSAEQLVVEAYRKKFDADISVTYQRLIVCTRETQSPSSPILACAGFQMAGDDPLFSERYLPEGVETLISRATQQPVSRDQIIEVGSLASKSAGIGMQLVRAVPFAGWCLGQRHLLVTATDGLRAMLNKIGMVYEILGPARIDSIPVERRAAWGGYYRTDPQCIFIPLARNTHLFGCDVHHYAFAPEQLNLSLVKRSA